MFYENSSQKRFYTLIEVITRRTIPSSIIVSDCWATYIRLALNGYIHLTIKYNTILSTPLHWHILKKLKTCGFYPKLGTKKSMEYLSGYFAEFIWRKKQRK